MKKIISLIVLLSLAIGVMLVLASCNGTNPGADSSATQSSEEVKSSVSSQNSDSVISSNKDTTDTSNDDFTDETTDTTSSSAADSTDKSEGNTTNSSDLTDDDNDTTPEIIRYVIRAVDVFGEKPTAIVSVEIYKDGDFIDEMPLRQGSAAFRLEAGEYTFEIKSTECEFYYDANSCVLTTEEPEKTVVLYNYANSDNAQEIYIYDEDTRDHVPYNAVQVEEGASYVTIDRPQNSYFLFTPTRGGIYKISYESSKKLTIGYYGSPHNVLQSCPLDVVDGAFEIEVKNEGVNVGNQGGTTQIVIGIRSASVKGCVLKIERIGNATVEMPWTEVQADKNLTKVDNYVNSEFVDFDIFDKTLSVVYNENDGYYHLNAVDGPVIFLRIDSAVIESTTETETIYKYLPSFVLMGQTGSLCKVFYDEEGQVVLKERYNELFYQYAELCGVGGMYPLNKQLAEIVKNLCDHNGWTDLDGQNQIFGDKAGMVVEENAWLFACAYELKGAKGTEEKPAAIAPSTQDSPVTNAVLVTNGTPVVLRTIKKATITINNAQNVKIIANDGTEYVADAETGVLSVVINANQNFTVVYESDEEQASIRFTFIEFIG